MSDFDSLALLEKKFAMYVIMTVKNKPGCTKSDVIKQDDGNDRTKFLRIQEMIDNDIIVADEEKRQHNTIKLYLTPKGEEVAEYIEKISNVLNSKCIH